MPDSNQPIQILLIDDDEISREVMSLLLTAQGHVVDAVESGKEALNHLQESPAKRPHAILIDLQMPGLSGAELAHALRDACAQGGTIPILVAMSGSLPDRATLSSFDGFLPKPFTMQDFANALITRPAGAPIASETPATSAASLDEAIYRKLSESLPQKQLHELYRMCLSDVEARTARMRAAGAGGDDATYRREAHAIKGGCGMVGAAELHSLAARMEAQGLGDANHVASLDEMLLLCERLRGILIAR